MTDQLERDLLTMCPERFDRLVPKQSHLAGGQPTLVRVPVYHEWRQYMAMLEWRAEEGEDESEITEGTPFMGEGGFYCTNCTSRILPDGRLLLNGSPPPETEDAAAEVDAPAEESDEASDRLRR